MRPGVLTGRDVAAALVVVVVWGVNFVVMKFALRDFTPFQLGAARYVFAVLPLVLFVRPPAIPWKWLALYGLFQGVGQFGILFVALKVGMTAALASVLLQTQVFFTALFGFVLLHERASRPLQAGMVLAALGLACFALNYLSPAGAGTGTGTGAATTLAGFALTLGAAAMWAMSNIVARHVQQGGAAYSPMAFVVWSGIFAILPFTLLSLVFDPEAARWQWTQARASSWLAVAYLGWVATLLGYSLWTGLLKRHPANRVAPFSLGVPVVGLTTGMLVLGEAITPWQWAGITLVVAALACVMLGGMLKPALRCVGPAAGWLKCAASSSRACRTLASCSPRRGVCRNGLLSQIWHWISLWPRPDKPKGNWRSCWTPGRIRRPR